MDPIAQWVFTPFTGDMEAGRFVLMTGWPSFPSIGSSFGNFFTDGAGDDVMVEWAATATCETRNLYTVEELTTRSIDREKPPAVIACGSGAFQSSHRRQGTAAGDSKKLNGTRGR